MGLDGGHITEEEEEEKEKEKTAARGACSYWAVITVTTFGIVPNNTFGGAGEQSGRLLVANARQNGVGRVSTTASEPHWRWPLSTVREKAE